MALNECFGKDGYFAACVGQPEGLPLALPSSSCRRGHAVCVPAGPRPRYALGVVAAELSAKQGVELPIAAELARRLRRVRDRRRPQAIEASAPTGCCASLRAWLYLINDMAARREMQKPFLICDAITQS